MLKSHVKQDGQVHENAAVLEIGKIVLDIFVDEKCPLTAKVVRTPSNLASKFRALRKYTYAAGLQYP